MAMYYYARKLQKNARKAKAQPQNMMMANGSIPSGPMSSVGCVSGSGSGAPCTSSNPKGLGLTLTTPGGNLTPVGNVTSSNSSSTTTESTNNSGGSGGSQFVGLRSGKIVKCHQQPSGPSTCTSPVAVAVGVKNNSDSHSGLTYEEGVLKSGSLESLVHHLVPTGDYYPDRAYIFAFILSSRLFIRPNELLATVFQKTFQNKFEGGTEVKVVRQLVQFLGEWAEMFPYDFKDDNGLMMANVRAITQKCVSVDPPAKKEVSVLLTSLLARLTALEKFESILQRLSAESVIPINKIPASPTVLAICPDPNLLAEQLTHIELERFYFIGAQEYIQAFLKESPTSSNGGGDLLLRTKEVKKTRLECYVQWFHHLGLIVATDVCKTEKKKLRARCLEFWVEVARECFNIGNFNSLMAIITGLNIDPVARLKKTWGKMSCDLLSSLENHMDPSNNFASYRSLLKSAVWHSTKGNDGRQKVVIPFFSLLVKDLYFLKEDCLIPLPNGHLNFEKFRKLGRQVGEIISWQQVTCPFPKVPSIIQAIQTLPTMQENALLIASFDCESPTGSPEKDMLKSAKETKLLEVRENGQNNLVLPSPSSSSVGGQSPFENTLEHLCRCLPEFNLQGEVQHLNFLEVNTTLNGNANPDEEERREDSACGPSS